MDSKDIFGGDIPIVVWTCCSAIDHCVYRQTLLLCIFGDADGVFDMPPAMEICRLPFLFGVLDA